jgi:DNA-binding transcriptional regulator YdaS (Cro superfamily)
MQLIRDSALNAKIEALGGRSLVAAQIGVSTSYLSRCVAGERTMTDSCRFIIEEGLAERMDVWRMMKAQKGGQA